METIRQYGLQCGYALLVYLSELPRWTGIHPDPTEGKMRWQMYTALAYGYKGLLCFTYSTDYDPGSYGDPADRDTWALIGLDGNPTPKYYIVQDINGEIENLAPILNKLTS